MCTIGGPNKVQKPLRTPQFFSFIILKRNTQLRHKFVTYCDDV